MHFLAQVSVTSSENPIGILITVVIIAVVGFLVWRGRQNIQQKREAFQVRAQELGWEYSGEEAWQHANAARFQIIYSFSSNTNGVPWAMIYSRKVRSTATVAVNSGAGVSHNRPEKTDRLDWRSDAVSIPTMVFLKYKQPAFVNHLASMINIDANTYVEYMLSLGLTEADNQSMLRMPLVVNLLTKTNPFGNADYGLKPVSSFEHPIFEAHSVSDEAVTQVLNGRVLAVLDAWRQSLEARYGSNSASHYLYQPTILFYEGGVFLSFDSEQNSPADYEAIVEFGTALVNAQR